MIWVKMIFGFIMIDYADYIDYVDSLTWFQHFLVSKMRRKMIRNSLTKNEIEEKEEMINI
jgi:hypothetical protein